MTYNSQNIMDIINIKKRANNKNSLKKYKDYHFDLFEKFLGYADPINKDVAILGCSTGLDCQLFVLAGAKNVIGIDLDPRIGNDYQAANVSYLKQSITNLTEICSNSLELIYSVAVFEHVFDIPVALNECKRILKPDGIAYILSSPLWNSPYGHHYKPLLEAYPWIHLVLGQRELYDFLTDKGICEYDGKTIDQILDYIYHPQHFNRFPAPYYQYAVKNIDGIEVLDNKLSIQSLNQYSNTDYFNGSIIRGYSEEELLSSLHLLVFKKIE